MSEQLIQSDMDKWSRLFGAIWLSSRASISTMPRRHGFMELRRRPLYAIHKHTNPFCIELWPVLRDSWTRHITWLRTHGLSFHVHRFTLRTETANNMVTKNQCMYLHNAHTLVFDRKLHKWSVTRASPQWTVLASERHVASSPFLKPSKIIGRPL